MRKLSDWLTSYLAYKTNSEPKESYRKWVGISLIASCLQRKCYLHWEGVVYPNLYIVLVGPSAARKGTAMRQGKTFLDELGITVCPQSIIREQLIHRLRLAGNETLSDSKTGTLIVPGACLTIHSEELSVLLGKNSNQLMADLCDWYDCPNIWTYETKHQGIDPVENVWINLMGATTPTLLQSTLSQEAIGGGLTSRIIFVYERMKGKSCPFPFLDVADIQLHNDLLIDLEEIRMMSGEFEVSNSFLDSWGKWYVEQDKNPPFDDQDLVGYNGRRAWHMLKICMVINVSRIDGDMRLTNIDFDRALRELVTIETRMPLVFSGVGQSNLAKATSDIMAVIATHKEITFNKLLGMFYRDVDVEELTRIIQVITSIEKDGKRPYKIVGSVVDGDRRIAYTGGKD